MVDTSIPIDDHNAHNGKQEKFTPHVREQSELSKNFGDIKDYFNVSDNMFVSMPISEEKDEMKVIKDDEDVSKIDYIKRIKVGSITKWDINTPKFEAYFLFDNSFDVDDMKLSNNGVLLFVYGKKRKDIWYKDSYPCITRTI
ncbi:hypothetical protein C2G38_2139922 [Gigaspora rosea]|uniref:Uncharacterized protein n=1 Tax=Gigaspora rosea TaxID=44941 RepID=A0A397VMG9_9GLOM|nr:hypothetical protein C2G38_2139922 [Gigaspora rosea]